MQAYPHHYKASAAITTHSAVTLRGKQLPDLLSDAPAEFGGPGDQWSPETLLVASVADCFILTFKAIARGSQLDWQALQCEVEGVLDRVDNVSQFVSFVIHAKLWISGDMDEQKAQKILEKSEAVCLITNSLKAEKQLQTEITIGKTAFE